MTRAKPRGPLGRLVDRPLPSWARKARGVAAIVPVGLMVAAAGTAVAVSAGPPPAPIAAVGAPNVTRGEPSVAPPSPDATVPEASAPRRRITMAFTGDILIHERLWQTAAAQAGPGERYDFRSLFAPIRPTIADADLAICHLETPLSPAGRQPSSFPVFSTPPEVASAIAWAGYDGCSTASNHSLDGGTAGVVATLDHLDAAGLGHAGTARTRAEASRIARYRVGGVVVAHLSATWSFNGSTPDTAWRAERIDTSALIVDARRARRAGADLVVVSLHAGVEYTHRPTAYQRRVAERLTRGDAIDLIVGHHAHVVQPIHRVHGTWVAFGLGNHLSGMTSSLGTEAVQDGVVLVVTAQRRLGGTWSLAPRVVPTRVDGVRWRVLPVGVTLDRSWASPQLRAELRASWARTLAAVRLLGDGIRPVPRG